jgi:hypothetical protein
MAELAETVTRSSDPRFVALRRVAVVPALNEESSIGGVIDEIRSFDPDLDIVVVDDGSTDNTSRVATARGAHVLRLPFNLGIGGAVQTGFRYAHEQEFELAVRLDGDGQHDASQLGLLLGPILDGTADIVIGSRFAARGGYRSSLSRRFGIGILAGVVSLLVRQRLTDPTSGFQALNRHAIRLFAADYPHDYPEVEATVMLFKHRLRVAEVPVRMRERSAGRSSIGAAASVYYMVKVLLAIVIAMFRRNVLPLEEK